MGVIGEWERGPVIGRGASATVSIATDRRTGQVFAVKSVEMARAGALRHEQSVLSALSSPYVVSCLGSGVSSDGGGGAASMDLFLEYAPGGSLADEIKRRGGRCDEAVIQWRARDVLRGLAYVHAAGVAHCDVKARNVLLGGDGRAMLADFGCARWAAAEGAFRGGTPAFMSPEAARGEAQGAAADVWALGCTVIEMATGAAPWRWIADPVAALRHVAWYGEVPRAPAWLSRDGKDFLSRCLVRDPAARWTAEQLLAHPFVASASCCEAAAAADTAAPPARWVSPKSVLDNPQGFWEEEEEVDDDENCSGSDALTAGTGTTAADRVGALAGGADDWTWSGETWITVTTSSSRNDGAAAASSGGSEADAAAGSGAEASEASAGVGDDAAGGVANLRHCNSNCNLTIRGSNSECSSSDSAIISSNNSELRWLVSFRGPSWRQAFGAVPVQLLGVGASQLASLSSRAGLRLTPPSWRACVDTSQS